MGISPCGANRVVATRYPPGGAGRTLDSPCKIPLLRPMSTPFEGTIVQRVRARMPAGLGVRRFIALHFTLTPAAKQIGALQCNECNATNQSPGASLLL